MIVDMFVRHFLFCLWSATACAFPYSNIVGVYSLPTCRGGGILLIVLSLLVVYDILALGLSLLL